MSILRLIFRGHLGPDQDAGSACADDVLPCLLELQRAVFDGQDVRPVACAGNRDKTHVPDNNQICYFGDKQGIVV